MSASSNDAGGQPIKKPSLATSPPIEQWPRLANGAPQPPPFAWAEPNMSTRIEAYMDCHSAAFAGRPVAHQYASNIGALTASPALATREVAIITGLIRSPRAEGSDLPPAPAAPRSGATGLSSANASRPPPPPSFAELDMKTQMAMYKASQIPVNPPNLKQKTVILPRFEAAHGLTIPIDPRARPRGEPHYSAKMKLAKMEQELSMETSARISPFSPTKSKELDSGIVSLETPSSFAGFSPKPSPTLSTISSPATFSSPSSTPAGSVTSAASSPPACSPPAAPACRRYFPFVHDAAALAEIKRNFEKAQQLYPAEAAIFIGNLPAHYTDLHLSRELVNAFKKFGHLDVQVRRQYTADHVKPTAILQFTHPEAASKAIFNSVGWRIGGRKLRVDRSSAHRYITVWRDGTAHPGPLSSPGWYTIVTNETHEAEQYFRRFAPFDDVTFAITHWTYMGRPENDGIRITFTNYGAFLAAKKALQVGAVPYKEKKLFRGKFYY